MDVTLDARNGQTAEPGDRATGVGGFRSAILCLLVGQSVYGSGGNLGFGRDGSHAGLLIAEC